jgi:hypothetical protein
MRNLDALPAAKQHRAYLETGGTVIIDVDDRYWGTCTVRVQLGVESVEWGKGLLLPRRRDHTTRL